MYLKTNPIVRKLMRGSIALVVWQTSVLNG